MDYAGDIGLFMQRFENATDDLVTDTPIDPIRNTNQWTRTMTVPPPYWTAAEGIRGYSPSFLHRLHEAVRSNQSGFSEILAPTLCLNAPAFCTSRSFPSSSISDHYVWEDLLRDGPLLNADVDYFSPRWHNKWIHFNPHYRVKTA